VRGAKLSSTKAYLDLLKLSLTDEIYAGCRKQGDPRPERAHTMLSVERLQNIQECIDAVIDRGIDGDLFQAGVWRGGAAAFMGLAAQALIWKRRGRGLSAGFRPVWAADSFCGFPPAARPEDRVFRPGDMSVTPSEVKANLKAHGAKTLVHLWKGYFSDSLPRWSGQFCHRKLAVLHIDADMYDSTQDCLEHLYKHVPVGGFVIIDDYGAHAECRAAVEDFRLTQGIIDEPVQVDWTAVYWRKSHA